MARNRPLTVSSFLKLERELTELLRLDHPRATKAEKAAEAGIRYICNKLFRDKPDPFSGKRFGARLVILLRKRSRTSGDAVDYQRECAHLLARLAENTVEKQSQNSKESRRQRANSKHIRNMQMARKFLSKREHSSKSPSALKAEIGKSYRLGRSASITAIDRGLESL